jgi:RHS repeat-associated protein
MLSEGDTARHLEYDCVDRLRCFYVKTGIAEPSKYTYYLYDGGGNRVKKITRTQGGGYTATTYIDGTFEYTKESGVGEQNILHLMGGATRRIGAALGDSTPAIKYNLADHLGSSCVQLDTNGTTVSIEEYYPFGETSFGSYAKKRYRFCGKEKDEESGLYYYGMRYYSPWTCRFINVDPLAEKYPFYTPYQYAGNQPIIAVDLDGLEPDPDETTNNQKTNELPEQNNSTESDSLTENNVTDSINVENIFNDDSLNINNQEDQALPLENDSTTIAKPLPLPKIIKSNTNIPQV